MVLIRSEPAERMATAEFIDPDEWLMDWAKTMKFREDLREECRKVLDRLIPARTCPSRLNIAALMTVPSPPVPAASADSAVLNSTRFFLLMSYASLRFGAFLIAVSKPGALDGYSNIMKLPWYRS